MSSVRRRLTIGSGVALVIGVCLLASGGDLNPPAGPVAPTMKSLDEMEPRIAVNAVNTPGDANSIYKITQPGSYYLTGNVMGSVSHFGVEISASGVTLDLNGYELVGVPGSLDGVTVPGGSLQNIIVRNGTVRGWGDHGVDLRAENVELASINASDNGAGGIRLGDNSTARDCRALNNSGIGITLGNTNTLTDSVSRENTALGINANSDNCIITRCVTSNNQQGGISVGDACQVIACVAASNNGDGISATGVGALIADCTAMLNLGIGIWISSDSRATNNISHDNTGVGIWVDGSSNRIEDNQCTDNGTGFFVNAAGNILRSNTCSGNTVNWNVAAGNVCLIVQAATAGAILGNAGGTSPGALIPDTNFTY
ncbi:MAG: right-handed parallel beta-helix repeat-containing protein [Phycisphaeraceae bacterium]|nr:right-handed parallel beta-helix repeat-containing protein [Phycisphaerales bacterium]MCB9843303.1 right-handed parallel beta-helix repeat-containing protein [Phycisphaeraceae bacterium]